jgi:AcrR family transcriptional regulator
VNVSNGILTAAAVRPLIARRREARAREILDAAMAIVASGGLEALTLQRLGKELGVAPPAIYRYFDSKDAVLARLETDAVLELQRALAAAGERADALVRARYMTREVAALVPLLAMASAYAELAAREPARHQLVSLLLADPRLVVGDAAARGVLDAARPLLAEASARFAAAAAARALGDGGDPLRRALLYWAGLQGGQQLAKLDRLAPGMFAVLPAMARALLLGFGADPATLDAADKVWNSQKKEKS